MTCLEITLSVLLVIAITFLFNERTKSVDFNSNVDNREYEIKQASFEVVNARKTYSSQGIEICEYTIQNSFFSKEDAKGWVYNEYKIYGKPGEYKVGDILTLTKQ